jgi:hypothetical protein
MIFSGCCDSFKRELLLAQHDFSAHEFRMALYTADADLSPSTTAYVTSGEITGPGYTVGGQPLRNVQILGPQSRASYITWDDPVWANSTLKARGALIYNQTAAQRAVVVLDFVTDQSSNSGDFRVKFPPPAPFTALVRLL